MRGFGRVFERGGIYWTAYYHRGREYRESTHVPVFSADGRRPEKNKRKAERCLKKKWQDLGKGKPPGTSERRRIRPVDASDEPAVVSSDMTLPKQPREHWVEPIPNIAALPAAEDTGPEERAILGLQRRGVVAQVVAVGWLDLDDVRTLIREQRAAVRARDVRADIEHAHTAQGALRARTASV